MYTKKKYDRRDKKFAFDMVTGYKTLKTCPCGKKFVETHKLQIFCPKCRAKTSKSEQHANNIRK